MTLSLSKGHRIYESKDLGEQERFVGSPLRILHLEDNRNDAALVQAALATDGLACEVVRMETRAEFAAALDEGGWDLILCDFSLPSFDGKTALALARERCPGMPFIFVSGTIGEEAAIDALTSGATDYVLKQRPARFIPAVRRALQESEERRARQRAEETIREQAALLDVAHDAILLCGLEGSLSFWNKGAERLYGWTAQEATGKNVSELLHKPLPSHLATARQTLLEKGKWSGELHQVTKDGKAMIVASSWTLVRDQEDKPRSILVINTDITEKKHLEAQLFRSQRMESLGTLAGGIAHDLNNVMAPILMAAQLLQRIPTDDEAEKWLKIIETSVRRGRGMIKQVLTFARGVEGERCAIQVRHLIAELEKIIRDTFPRSIQIEANLPSDLRTIIGDSTQLYQVLLNLCVNARDAMPDGGRLRIEAGNLLLEEHDLRRQPDAKPGPYVVLTVSDTGTGISPQVIERVFDPFFTTKGVGQGTGLGLSTALGFVKSHGGFMNVYSEVGRGTEFKVYLPAQVTAATRQPEEERPELPKGNGELVLVVDDEATILEMMKATLEAHGYRVLTAKDGTEAVASCAQHQKAISVVVTDMMMPLMDGPATIRALHKLDPAVKVIAVSGLMEDKKCAGLAETGATRFLEKPYTTEQLLHTLHEALTCPDQSH
jgi:two-component system cell cycle sensor histidine kinase/response regulator CckA